MEEIDKTHARFLRGGFGGLRVGFELRIVLRAVRHVRIFRVLMRDGAEEHDAWEGLPVRLRAAHILHEIDELLFEVVRLALEGLVVAEEGEHDIRLHMAQVIRHVHVPAAAREGVRAVAAGAHVAEAHVLLWQRTLQDGLHPTIVLHAVRQAIAKDRHGVAFAEGKRQRVFVVGWHIDERRLLRGRRGGTTATALRGWFTGFAVKVEVSELAAAFDIHRERIARRDVFDLKHCFARIIEQTQREAAQTLREALTAPQADRVNRLRRAQIDFPPRIRLVFDRVSHALAVIAVLVAIHGPTRVTTVSRGRLRGLAALRDVFATAHDFDFGDLDALALTRNLDADKTGRFARGDGGLGIHRSCGGRFFGLLRLLRLLRVVVRGDRAFKAGIHLRLDAASIRAAAEGVGLGGTDEGDVQVSRDLVFQADGPEHAIHHEPAIAFVRDVFGGAVERGKDSAFLAGRGLVSARPFAGHRRLRRVGR